MLRLACVDKIGFAARPERGKGEVSQGSVPPPHSLDVRAPRWRRDSRSLSRRSLLSAFFSRMTSRRTKMATKSTNKLNASLSGSTTPASQRSTMTCGAQHAGQGRPGHQPGPGHSLPLPNPPSLHCRGLAGRRRVRPGRPHFCIALQALLLPPCPALLPQRHPQGCPPACRTPHIPRRRPGPGRARPGTAARRRRRTRWPGA